MANIHMRPQQLPLALSCKHFIYFFTRVPVIIIVIHGHMMSASGKDLALKSVFCFISDEQGKSFFGVEGGGFTCWPPHWTRPAADKLAGAQQKRPE